MYTTGYPNLVKIRPVLRLQPRLVDSEIREKEEKFDELDGRGTALKENIRDLIKNATYYFPNPLPERSIILPVQIEAYSAI